MTRALMPFIGAGAALAGLGILARPAGLARRLGYAGSDAAAYGLRIAGAMLVALGLFLAGFSLTLSLTS